jgi:phosphoribosylformylglycinamidine synthase subunit PurS
MANYEIFVTYKQGIFDPPGATASRALESLGYQEVRSVKIGKYIRLEVADGPDELARVGEMCDKLLANPVIEDYRIVEAGGPVSAG